VVGYDLCLKAATKESWYNEWSTMCEVELNQMKPAEYPLAAEMKPEPGYVSTPITPGGCQSRTCPITSRLLLRTRSQR